MVVDTSAIVAAVTYEPDAVLYREAMLSAEAVFMSAVTAMETRIVLFSRHGSEAVAAFEEMLSDESVSIVPFDAAMAVAAFDAFLAFGKGRHAAGLNIVDCATYATAKILVRPLLFKGSDFARTDAVPAL